MVASELGKKSVSCRWGHAPFGPLVVEPKLFLVDLSNLLIILIRYV